MAIRYPTNYDKIADIPADLEDMAESIQDELDLKVNKVTGKGLSTNDYTDDEKSKLAGIATGAEVNAIETVKVNGTALTPSNKAVDVTVPTKTSDLTNDSGFGTYTKPSGGIPKTDLASAVQTSLEKADSAVQDVSGKEDKSNKVTSISSSSTNTQYPSAKLVYDELKEKQDQIDALVEENTTLKAQIPTGYKKVSSTTLTDASEGLPTENVVIWGATEQGENPSPENPQTIHKVTGNCNAKNSNKNLFIENNYTNLSLSTNGDATNVTKTENSFSFTSSSENSYSGVYITSEKIKNLIENFNENTTYTISIDVEVNTATNFLFGSSSNARENFSLTAGKQRISLQIPINTGLVFYNRYDGAVNYTISKIQFEISSTATDYIAHSEQNAPLSLGDIELYDGDKIQISYVNKAGYKKVTGANVIKKCNEYTFDGSIAGDYTFKDDNTNTISVNLYPNQIDQGILKGTNDIPIYCSDFLYVNDLSDTEHLYVTAATPITGGWKGNTRIYLNKTRLTGYSSSLTNAQKLDLFKTYLTQNPITIAYKSVQSTTTPITDTTLLAQLETLINLKTYKEVTHIDGTGADLAPVLEFDYYKDLTTIINELQQAVLNS